MSDTPEQQYSSILDYTAAYKVRGTSATLSLLPADCLNGTEIYHISEDAYACR